MHNKLKNLVIIAITLACANYALADTSLADLVAQSRKFNEQCPAIKDLKLNKKTMLWSADGGWKTYTQSFGTTIQSFRGAQWNGVQLGQIICVYSSKGAFTFPIKLFYNKQVVDPETASWTKAKTNVYNCLDTRDKCVFSPLISPKDMDPLEQAKQLKYDHTKDKLPEQNL
jgi:hypothetical protein